MFTDLKDTIEDYRKGRIGLLDAFLDAVVDPFVPPFARRIARWILHTRYRIRMAWQRALRTHCDEQLWNYKRFMIDHLRSACEYHLTYQSCVPNKHDGSGADINRDWSGDLRRMIAKIDAYRLYDDWTPGLDESGKFNKDELEKGMADEKRLWNEITEFVRLDAENLWD
jgi:hypothetical protein